MLYRPDVCNCTMPYVPRTVPAYAVRDSAYTADVFALTLVEIDVISTYCCKYFFCMQIFVILMQSRTGAQLVNF